MRLFASPCGWMNDCSLLAPHIVVYARRETRNPRGLDTSTEQNRLASRTGGLAGACVLSYKTRTRRKKCLNLYSDSWSTPRWCCAISNLAVSFVFACTFDYECVLGEFPYLCECCDCWRSACPNPQAHTHAWTCTHGKWTCQMVATDNYESIIWGNKWWQWNLHMKNRSLFHSLQLFPLDWLHHGMSGYE